MRSGKWMGNFEGWFGCLHVFRGGVRMHARGRDGRAAASADGRENGGLNGSGRGFA